MHESQNNNYGACTGFFGNNANNQDCLGCEPGAGYIVTGSQIEKLPDISSLCEFTSAIHKNKEHL